MESVPSELVSAASTKAVERSPASLLTDPEVTSYMKISLSP